MGFQTFLYHPIHGAHLFDSEALPDPELGWFDSPKKPRELNATEIPEEFKVPLAVAVKPKPKTEDEISSLAGRTAEPALPGPEQFDSFDEYMGAFTNSLDTALLPSEIEKQKKRAVQHYAQVMYNVSVSRRKRVDDMVDVVRGMAGD